MYQWILSPILAPACRFYPTCSEYAYQAILRYGLAKGFFLAFKRLVKCHPFNQGGIDAVPLRRIKKKPLESSKKNISRNSSLIISC